MRKKVSPDQLSLFDVLAAAEGPREFVLWYANMSGKGEHIYSRLPDRSIDFAARNMVASGDAEPILYTLAESKQPRAEHHTRLGIIVGSGKAFQIEDIWSQDSLNWFKNHVKQ